MRENSTTTESTINNSFTEYLKENYSFHNIFLPGYKPANDHLSITELQELEKMIEARDHFEIRQQIAKRYHCEN